MYAKAMNGKVYLRDVDAEAKILEQLIHMTNRETKGTIRLFTEHVTCGSCTEMIHIFQKYRPHMKIELSWKGGNVTLPPLKP